MLFAFVWVAQSFYTQVTRVPVLKSLRRERSDLGALMLEADAHSVAALMI